MAKGETKKTNKMLDTERAMANQQFTNFTNTQGQRSNEAYQRSNQIFDPLFKGYSDLASGALLPGSGGGGGGAVMPNFGQVKGLYNEFAGSGGVDIGAMRQGHGTLGELAGSGGYDAETKGRVLGDIQRLRDIGITGGVGEADRARMRGSGVFDEFAKTGGVSDADARNIRSRATSTIPAYYAAMSDEMARGRRIRGGSGAASNAMALRMARERSRAGAETALDAELGISDRVRQGRMWGAEGAATSEGQLQQLLTGNMLAGAGGAMQGEMGLANSIAGTRLGAATNLGSSEQNIQGIVQRGRMFGTQGLEGIAGAEAAAASSAGAASAADARFREGLRLEGLEGLSRLRGQAPGEVGMYDQNILAGIGGRAGLANEGLGMRYNAPGNQGTNWGQIAGMAAGIGGAMMTGGASLAIPAAMGSAGQIFKKRQNAPYATTGWW